MEMSEEFKQKLLAKTNVTRTYKSKHTYSLQQYGMRHADIHEPLSELFKEFDFEIIED